MIQGCVINIQRYSLHDGPGIRTVVFLKGCPLRCKWCSNPESWSPGREIFFDSKKCIGAGSCGLCIPACPKHAIAEEKESVRIGREACDDCLLCAAACPAKAIDTYGRMMTVNEVLRIVEQEAAFYKRSKGGMTLSGGEAAMQIDFTAALLAEAKKRRIHTAIETCGYAPWKNFQTIVDKLDFIYYDVKSVNVEKHREFTGVSPELILGNLERLCQAAGSGKIVVRTPVVPGFNDTEEDIRAISETIRSFGISQYELLKYHRFGMDKFAFLGKEYGMGDKELSEEDYKRLQEYAQIGTPSMDQ